MHLAGTLAAPALDRCQYDVGLFAQRIRTAGLNPGKGPFCTCTNCPAWALLGHDCDRFDHTESSFIVVRGRIGHGVAWMYTARVRRARGGRGAKTRANRRIDPEQDSIDATHTREIAFEGMSVSMKAAGSRAR